MSKYGYLEVFQRIPSTSRYRKLTVCCSNEVSREFKGTNRFIRIGTISVTAFSFFFFFLFFFFLRTAFQYVFQVD